MSFPPIKVKPEALRAYWQLGSQKKHNVKTHNEYPKKLNRKLSILTVVTVFNLERVTIAILYVSQ